MRNSRAATTANTWSGFSFILPLFSVHFANLLGQILHHPSFFFSLLCGQYHYTTPLLESTSERVNSRLVLDLFKITSFGKDFVQQWKIISVSFQSLEPRLLALLMVKTEEDANAKETVFSKPSSLMFHQSFAMRRSSSINHMNTNMMRSHVRDEIRSTRSLVEPLAGARPHEDSITAKTISPLLSAPRQHFVDSTFKKSEKMLSPWFEPGILTYKHQHLYH
ncbi:hypothetical protein YC2023_099981 [Brassica napus]